MDTTRRQELIERYRAGAEFVRKTAAEIAAADRLDVRPEPGEWTPREIIHHLADAELTSAVRLRKVLAEDDPVIPAYDQDLYAQRLHYDRPIEVSLDTIEAARRASADLLDALTEDEWSRQGTHTESGPYSVSDWLELYVAHPYDHGDQMRRAAGLA